MQKISSNPSPKVRNINIPEALITIDEEKSPVRPNHVQEVPHLIADDRLQKEELCTTLSIEMHGKEEIPLLLQAPKDLPRMEEEM